MWSFGRNYIIMSREIDVKMKGEGPMVLRKEVIVVLWKKDGLLGFKTVARDLPESSSELDGRQPMACPCQRLFRLGRALGTSGNDRRVWRVRPTYYVHGSTYHSP
jgi:hypothetical protein